MNSETYSKGTSDRDSLLDRIDGLISNIDSFIQKVQTNNVNNDHQKQRTQVTKHTHNIFIFSTQQAQFHYISSKAFLSINPTNIHNDDILYLKNDKNDFNIDYLNFLCDLESFPLKNIIFTKTHSNTLSSSLFSDIVNNTDLYNQFINIIVNSYHSGKYKYLFIRCVSYDNEIMEWYNNRIIKSEKYNYLKDYIRLGMIWFCFFLCLSMVLSYFSPAPDQFDCVFLSLLSLFDQQL